MTNEEYWAARNEELEREWYKKSQQEIEKELLLQYQRGLQHINEKIQALYARFAQDNGLDMVEAQRLLTGQEFRTWCMDIVDYVKEIQKTGDNELLRELNTLAMRSRISRLDKLYGDTLREMAKICQSTKESLDKFLPSAYENFYYHDIFEIGKKRGLQRAVSKVDTKHVEDVLRTPWSGKNYSARIWANGEKLAETIRNVTTAAMHRGATAQDLSRYVQQRMNVGYSQAVRLVRTELNYTQNRAILDGIKDCGMKYYRFVATLDRRTSSQCREHDGKTYPVEDYSPGTNAPPLHPHCRSTIVGSVKGDSKPKGERGARNADGKYIRVPASMTYEDWKTVYIDKKMTIEEWKAARSGGIIKAKKGTATTAVPSSSSPPSKQLSKAYQDLSTRAKAANIDYKPVLPLQTKLSELDIIKRISGPDQTKGSCVSLAFAFAGNVLGLDVLDFRGGTSQDFFSHNKNIKQMCNLTGVRSKVVWVKKEVAEVEKMLQGLDDMKLYYLVAGKHAAIVRRTGVLLHYLELQSGSAGYPNGWHNFTAYGSVQDTLKKRFGCRKTVGGYVELIDIESLRNNPEFQDLLGYINTDANKQQKGAGGHVR